MADAAGFVFELDEKVSKGDIVAFTITTPAGHVLQVWSQIELKARTGVLRQLAIYGENVGTAGLGYAALRQLARAAMEAFDVDALEIEGARRTTGPYKGRVVPSLVFRSKRNRPDDPDAADAGSNC